MPQQEVYSSLPLALIYKLEQRAEPKLAKFILSCGDGNDTNNLNIDRRKYKPSHLVLLLKYHHRHEYSFGGVALLELNRIGVELKSPSKINEDNEGGRLIRINDVNGKPLGLFADEESVNTTHPVVISEWNEREMIFSQSIDLSSKSFVKFKLNQKKVEESHVERVEIEVSHQISERLYRAENPLQVPTIGRAQNVLLPVVSFDSSTKKVCLGLFNIEKQYKEKAPHHSLKVSEKFSTEEADYAFYIALMESNLGQKYILKYSPINAAHSSVGVLDLNNSKKFKYTPIHVDNFDSLFKKYMHKTSQILCHTQLSEGKYLFMIHSKPSSTRPSTDFQHYFTDEIVWILIDVNEKRARRVYPRVFDIATESATTIESSPIQSEGNRAPPDETTFQTIQKKKRSGKIHKKFNHTEEEQFYLDGDLNAGYSDPSLLKKIKRNSSSSNTIVQQTSKSNSKSTTSSVMIPIMKEDLINNEVTMRSFKPFFYSNPDIFQVLVFFSKMVENGVDFNPHHGKMFSFFFKFKNEAKVKLRKVGRRFSDVTLVTCSKSKAGASSNRQFSSFQMNNY